MNGDKQVGEQGGPGAGGPGAPDTRSPEQRRLDALKANQWKPGQSGNPAGRPKRKTLIEEIASVLEEQIEIGGRVVTKQEALARVLVTEMLKGNPRALEAYLSRVAPQLKRVEIVGDPQASTTDRIVRAPAGGLSHLGPAPVAGPDQGTEHGHASDHGGGNGGDAGSSERAS